MYKSTVSEKTHTVSAPCSYTLRRKSKTVENPSAAI